MPPCQILLALARILWKMPLLLILDEDTTRLDFHTLLGLVTALSTFNGAILLVSHERHLVRSVVEERQDAGGDADAGGSAELATVEDEDEVEARRRTVYVLRGPKLQVQEKGMEQFEAGLEKRAKKMIGYS